MSFEEIWLAHRKKVVRLAVRQARGRGDSDLVDELAAAGLVGLWQAAGQYDESRGDFWQFAHFRVRGAMRDASRSLDPLSRQDRRRVRVGSPGEILVQPVGEEEASCLPSGGDPESSLGEAEERELLSHLLGSLPRRSREVVRRSVLGDERLVDLAGEIGVSPSRLCQIVKSSLRELRRSMVYCEVCKKKKLDGPTWCPTCGGRLRHLRSGEVVEEYTPSPAARTRTCGKQVPPDVLANAPAKPPEVPVKAPAEAPAEVHGRGGRRPCLHEHGGESLTLQQWADKIGMKYRTLAAKIKRGGKLDEILSDHERSETAKEPAGEGDREEAAPPSGDPEETRTRSKDAVAQLLAQVDRLWKALGTISREANAMADCLQEIAARCKDLDGQKEGTRPGS